jgi:carotenoid cleavage dioxygenase-like enzyme
VTGKGELSAPMPREDLVTDHLVTYVLRQTPTKSEVTFVEVDASFQEVARSQTVRTEGLIHDLAFTDDWYVLVENAAKPRPIPALLGRAPLWSSFAWDGRPPTLLVHPAGTQWAARAGPDDRDGPADGVPHRQRLRRR